VPTLSDPIETLARLLEPDRVADTLYRNSPAREPVRVLQILLNELGYGEPLQWARFGADGDYGRATAAAVRTAASDRGQAVDGERVNRALLLELLGDAARRELQDLQDRTGTLLWRGTTDSALVRALQILLYQQGLGPELRWARFGADGDYGAATARAVQSFATHRGLASNGQRVDARLLGALLNVAGPLPEHPRRTLQPLLDAGRVETTLFQGSAASDAVQALQRLLNELGHGESLQWDRFGADGDYGPATANAVTEASRDLGLKGDGQRVDAELLRRLLEQDAVRETLRALLNTNAVASSLFRDSPARDAVRALQIRLHGLGYGPELQWRRFGADGDYGPATAAAVARFAADQGIETDGQRLTPQLVERLLERAPRPAPPAPPDAPEEALSVEDLGNRVRVSNGQVSHTFRQFRLGLYTLGDHPPLSFMRNHRALLSELGLTESLINVMVAVAENEGNLDAVNTWDNAFLSFGMLQWTAGTGDARGELAALLQRLQQQAPLVFSQYFGTLGLGTMAVRGSYGYLTLAGQTLDTSTAKAALRAPAWAFRFWHAGQDTTVQAVEVAHAASRLDTFYRHPSYQVEGYDIADLVNSEYGVALLFDQHVNRPGYVTGSLATALRRSGLAGDPATWGSTEEQRLLEQYLDVRADYGRYPMTHARERAARTRRYLERGIISGERGSFQVPA